MPARASSTLLVPAGCSIQPAWRAAPAFDRQRHASPSPRRRSTKHAQLGRAVLRRPRWPRRAPAPEHAADALAVALGDPASLSRGVETFDEMRRDARHQRLEADVPAVLQRIELAVPRHHPADVAGPMRAQRELPALPRSPSRAWMRAAAASSSCCCASSSVASSAEASACERQFSGAKARRPAALIDGPSWRPSVGERWVLTGRAP